MTLFEDGLLSSMRTGWFRLGDRVRLRMSFNRQKDGLVKTRLAIQDIVYLYPDPSSCTKVRYKGLIVETFFFSTIVS